MGGALQASESREEPGEVGPLLEEMEKLAERDGSEVQFRHLELLGGAVSGNWERAADAQGIRADGELHALDHGWVAAELARSLTEHRAMVCSEKQRWAVEAFDQLGPHLDEAH